MLLVAILFGQGSIITRADTVSTDETIPSEETVQPYAVILPTIVEDGAILTLITSASTTMAEKYTTFSLQIYKSNFSSSPSSAYFYVSGRLNHSVTGETIYDHMIEVGLGYRQSQTFIPVFTADIDRGIDFTKKLCLISHLANNTPYYLFARNYFDSGYIYGSVGLYYVEP